MPILGSEQNHHFQNEKWLDRPGRLGPAKICFNDRTVGHGDPSSYQVIENFEKFFLKKFDCLKMFEKCRTKDGT